MGEVDDQEIGDGRGVLGDEELNRELFGGSDNSDGAN